MKSTTTEHEPAVETEIPSPKRPRSHWLGFALAAVLILLLTVVTWRAFKLHGFWKEWQAQDQTIDHDGKPVRKPKRDQSKPVHALDPALEIAYRSLEQIQSSVDDYTATMVSRELVSGKLGAPQVMHASIRNRKMVKGRLQVPMAVYLKFQEPRNLKDREVIWVEGQNDGKMIVHEGGLKNIIRIKLMPDSFFAMLGSRYPMTEIGIEKMVAKLIQKGERDRKHGECEVKFDKNAVVDGVRCTLIRVIHPVQRDHFDFHIAEIYVDEKRLVPLRYASYDWPKKRGTAPILMEEYTYRNLKLNVGLQDKDFDPDNEKYDFP